MVAPLQADQRACCKRGDEVFKDSPGFRLHGSKPLSCSYPSGAREHDECCQRQRNAAVPALEQKINPARSKVVNFYWLDGLRQIEPENFRVKVKFSLQDSLDI